MKNSSIALVLGIVLGFLAAKIHVLQGFTLIPWGLAAVIIGYSSGSKKSSVVNGALYGFVLGLIFMLANYNGSGPVITKIPFFVLLGVISAVCGAALAVMSYFIGVKIKRIRK